jgi:hypothetical protein
VHAAAALVPSQPAPLLRQLLIVVRCFSVPQNFFSSNLSHKMVAAVKKSPAITPETKASTFMPIALDIWLDVRTKLRKDVIDFVCL